MKSLKKLIVVSLFFLLIGQVVSPASAATLSQGVYHSTDSQTISGYPQKINKLSINLDKPYTTIEAGISNPLATLRTTSSLAKLHTQVNHHVVGAINASFFDFGTKNPGYLLAINDDIKNLGSVSTNYNDFMYTPAAFGMTQDNKGKIGKFNFSLSVEHNGVSTNLTSLNRERNANESILFTSSYAFSHTRTNATGMEVIVSTSKSVDQQSKFGEKIAGKVVGFRLYGDPTSAEIPKNGFVISAVGSAEVDKIRNMKLGDDVSLTIDVDEEWQDSKFMLASGPLLVQNGQVGMTIDMNSPKVRERTAHTAVATDSTGSNVYFVTVDGRQTGYSQGMTLSEFANYLVSIGAYNAINLDGGGSTTMVTRKYAQVYPTLVNRPSDGSERGVSAILEAISTAPYGPPKTVNVSQDQEGIVAVGASVGYRVNSVLDQYYNALTADSSKLVLETVSNDIGKIENNRFIGQKAGSGTITAKYESATVSIPVTVTDTIEQLVASPSEIRLGTGENTTFSVNGVSKNQKVIFNSAAVSWTTSGGIGTINGTTFTAGTSQATGAITGAYGTTRVSIPVTVSNNPYELSGMESINGLKAESIRSNTTIALEKTLQSKDGAGSVKLNYDFTAFQQDTSAAYVNWTNGLAMPAAPKKIGAWVYGDGANHWLRAAVTDSTGRETAIDFTADGGLNWVGWKYVEANVPSTITAPIKLSKIYVAEPSSSKKGKGSIWIDSIQAIYSNQSTPVKSFVPSTSARVVDANKQFTVTFNQSMNTSYFNTKHVFVEDEYGVRQNVTVKMGTDATKLVVPAPAGGYVKGKSYRLVVTHFTQNAKGLRMVKDSITEFKIQ